jgi:hypothetical protein
MYVGFGGGCIKSAVTEAVGNVETTEQGIIVVGVQPAQIT